MMAVVSWINTSECSNIPPHLIYRKILKGDIKVNTLDKWHK